MMAGNNGPPLRVLIADDRADGPGRASPSRLRRPAVRQREGKVMTAEELISHVGSLREAADLVESIDDPELQRRRGWDLSGWCYELVPWGVRFVRREPRYRDETVTSVLAVLSQLGPMVSSEPAQAQGMWVVLSCG